MKSTTTRRKLPHRKTIAERHFNDLLEALEALLVVEELLSFKEHEVCDDTHIAIMTAEELCQAIREELKEMKGVL